MVSLHQRSVFIVGKLHR